MLMKDWAQSALQKRKDAVTSHKELIIDKKVKPVY
jgi:hypothetical protein